MRRSIWPFLRVCGFVLALSWGRGGHDSYLRGDWPTYQYDLVRNGATDESPPDDPVALWVYRSASLDKLKVSEIGKNGTDRPRQFDFSLEGHAFHVAVSNGFLYFGSSVDHKVYCLDAKTGEVRWDFFTEGPVHFPPTAVDKRVYIGSSDGFVYCLDGGDGSLLWKQPPTFDDPTSHLRRIYLGTRVLFPETIPTGVAVVDGRVCCVSRRGEQVFLCALDAERGTNLWKSEINDLTGRGEILASSTRLYFISDRETSGVFDLKSGTRLKSIDISAGETYALLRDEPLIAPDTDRGGQVVEESRERLASFPGNDMIMAKPYSYLHRGKAIVALDSGRCFPALADLQRITAQRKKWSEEIKTLEASPGRVPLAQIQSLEARRSASDELFAQAEQTVNQCSKWTVSCESPIAMILAHGMLIVGGEGKVVAYDGETGMERWSLSIAGNVRGLAVTEGYLFVSTDEGSIHCFADRAVAAQQPAPIPSPDSPVSTSGPPSVPASVVVNQGEPSSADRELPSGSQEGIPELDFNSPFGIDELTEQFTGTVRDLLQLTGLRRGTVLIVGAQSGRLAYHLATQSELHIVIVEPAPEIVAKIRRTIDSVGLYGTRIAVHQGELRDFQFDPSSLVDLVLAERMMTTSEFPGSLSEISRTLQADGSVIVGSWGRQPESSPYSRMFAKWRDQDGLASDWKPVMPDRGTFWFHRRSKLPPTGE